MVPQAVPRAWVWVRGMNQTCAARLVGQSEAILILGDDPDPGFLYTAEMLEAYLPSEELLVWTTEILPVEDVAFKDACVVNRISPSLG